MRIQDQRFKSSIEKNQELLSHSNVTSSNIKSGIHFQDEGFSHGKIFNPYNAGKWSFARSDAKRRDTKAVTSDNTLNQGFSFQDQNYGSVTLSNMDRRGITTKRLQSNRFYFLPNKDVESRDRKQSTSVSFSKENNEVHENVSKSARAFDDVVDESNIVQNNSVHRDRIRHLRRVDPITALYGYPKSKQDSFSSLLDDMELDNREILDEKDVKNVMKKKLSSKGIYEQRYRDRAAGAGYKMRECRAEVRAAEGSVPTKNRRRLRRVYNPETNQFEFSMTKNTIEKSGKENALVSAGRHEISYAADNVYDYVVKDNDAVFFEENQAVAVANQGVRIAKNGKRKVAAYKRRRRRTKPFRERKKAYDRYEKSQRKFAYKRYKAENPEATIAQRMRYRFRYLYKRKVYQLKKESGNVVGGIVKSAGHNLSVPLKYGWKFIRRKPAALLVVLLCGCLLLSNIFASVTSFFEIITASSYASAKEEDILEVNNYYTALEDDWKEHTLRNLEKIPGFPNPTEYDVLRIDVQGGFWHNPYALAAYLSVLFGDNDGYRLTDEMKEFLEDLFFKQYKITWTFTKTENTIYLDVSILNKGIDNVVYDDLGADPDSYERYQLIYEQKGNNPDLFGEVMEDHIGSGAGNDYSPSLDAMSDANFAKIYNEAKKYLGWHYAWGGASPSTSFDCSGLVYWVYNHTGVAHFGRTTAQGLYNMSQKISKEYLKPGDLVFFAGTNSASPNFITHVGIYIGDGKMINAQSSGIKIANVFSGYWNNYYAGSGRL